MPKLLETSYSNLEICLNPPKVGGKSYPSKKGVRMFVFTLFKVDISFAQVARRQLVKPDFTMDVITD